MFKQAAALWKRLRTPQPTADLRDGPRPQERRVWVRFPARTEAQFKPAGTEDAALVNAKVLDVSLGGTKLLVDRGFKEGSLISLDLPGGDGPSDVSVLACVVHADQRADGAWVLGCSFSQELTALDLQRFGIVKAKPAQPDQRGWSRFDCQFHVYYTETNADTAVRREARVANISAGGIALLVDRDVANGSMLSLDLCTDRELVTSILACVVHVSQLPDGGRALGCNFICELSEEHLNALLFEPARA
jgi:c-di-GMP-binding flagellar brake protein YcgR